MLVSTRSLAHGSWGLVVLVFLGTKAFGATVEAPAMPSGETGVHDPSTILRTEGGYVLVATGRGLNVLRSDDLAVWRQEGRIFEQAPGWVEEVVPRFRGSMWAPDWMYANGRYHLYYSVSRFGRQTSAIGLATSPTLDAASGEYRWTDHGPVIRSEEGSSYNAIDPYVTIDAEGRWWMAFGSFWQGIYLFELDGATGMRKEADGPVHRVAWKEEIEAPSLARHGEHYYLFVNWGRCCRGTNSTYEVRVGRSRVVTGPYRDKDGRDLVDAGGTLFLATSGRFIGPGHVSVMTGEQSDWFSYHYYDGERRGRSQLGLGRMEWGEDGWPRAVVNRADERVE